ncbi:MAG TPA: hypothetical protein VFA30_01005 [Gaiellaceae bacterium]|nr:hypothetical protein [Gaiellaceae bacterium]
MPTPLPPVIVMVSPPEAAETLAGLLEDYFAVLEPGDDESTVTIEPVDDMRRGVVIYRVIQASRTVAARHPESSQFLVTEEGSRWRLPPPAL